MREIKRYELVVTESKRNVIEAIDGQWIRYADYDYVLNLLLNQCEENEEEVSMKAHLLRNSVENNKRITKVSEENKQLQARIKELVEKLGSKHD